MRTYAIDGVVSRRFPIYCDVRGRFSEIYRQSNFPNFTPLQDNYSYSQKGVLRGFHYVAGDGQNQILSILNGKIIDFILDLRTSSDTFLCYLENTMSHDGINQIYIPHYCAHGFLAMTDNVILQYKTDAYYGEKTDETIQFLDPKIGIKLDYSENFVRSEKDINAKLVDEHSFF